jgi:Tfp pilus assembly protein PilN
MFTELTNLLPRDRVRAFRREYFFRLLTVLVAGLGCLVFAWGVLLFPSYVFLQSTIDTKNAELTALGSASQSADQRAVDARLTALASNASYLSALAKTPSASAQLQEVLAVARPGVRLVGFVFTPPKDASMAGTLAVSGVADSRDVLRSYDLALQSIPGVSSADLPVSAYAKESNIAFTITLSTKFSNASP